MLTAKVIEAVVLWTRELGLPWLAGGGRLANMPDAPAGSHWNTTARGAVLAPEHGARQTKGAARVIDVSGQTCSWQGQQNF